MSVAQRRPRSSPADERAPRVPATASQQRSAEPDRREPSSEFRRTGEELHPNVYKSVVLAFAWIVGFAWLAFGTSTEAALLATVGIVLGIVFFGIPVILRRTNRMRTRDKRRDLEDFLWSSVEIATGRLPGWEAYLQIMIIPLSLAVAATILGSIWIWVR